MSTGTAIRQWMALRSNAANTNAATEMQKIDNMAEFIKVPTVQSPVVRYLAWSVSRAIVASRWLIANGN